MLKAIVAHSNYHVNPYNEWLSDAGYKAFCIEYDAYLDSIEPMPFDEKLDALEHNGWIQSNGRIENANEICRILIALPNGCKTAINDCEIWKQNGLAYNARRDVIGNWRIQGGTVEDIAEYALCRNDYQWNLIMDRRAA